MFVENALVRSIGSRRASGRGTDLEIVICRNGRVDCTVITLVGICILTKSGVE